MPDPLSGHPLERELYEPLVGSTMLELGNKIQRGQTFKAHFEGLGFTHTSVDWNGKDGALRLDLRQPLNLGTFDMVSNIGTTEHVGAQEPVWRNICEALHLGSIFVSTTPKPGCWSGHGLYYPTEQFYTSLGELNGLEVERLFVTPAGYGPDYMIFARMVRVRDMVFVMPDSRLLINA